MDYANKQNIGFSGMSHRIWTWDFLGIIFQNLTPLATAFFLLFLTITPSLCQSSDSPN